MKYILIFILFGLASYSYSDDTESEALIDELLVLSGSTTMELVSPFVEEFSTSLADQLVQSRNPSLPQKANDILASEIRLFLYDRFLNNTEFKKFHYTVYQKYFTTQELRELVAFYKSDLGKKVSQNMPKIVKEGSEVSGYLFASIQEDLLKNIGPRLNKRMAEHGW